MKKTHYKSIQTSKVRTHSTIYDTMCMSGFLFISAIICSISSFVLSPVYVEAATTIKTATTSTSLVGWWTFDDATGTKATDFSGYGNTGTITCSGGGCTVPTFIPGKRASALDFFSNGTVYGVVNLSGSVPAASANQITVSAWYYYKGGGGDPRIVNRNWCTAGSWLMHRTLGFGVTTSSGCAGQRFASFGSMNTGQWYFLAGVFDGSNVYAYRDGVRISTNTAAGTDVSTNVAGLNMMTGNNGYLDDVRIYNRALSANEISVLYRSGQTALRALGKSGLIGYWPFDEGTSTLAGDFSGSGNNGTLVNMSSLPSTTSGWTQGKRGGSVAFDGINDYINIAQPNIQTSPNVFTISGWIYPDNQYGRFITPNANGIDNWVGYDNTNQRLEFFFTEIADVNNRARYSAINSIPINRWTQWAVSINDKDIKIYINGVLDSSYTETINIGGWTGNWVIGQRGNSTNWFKGRLDDLRIYNRILSDDEIKSIYKSNQTLVNAPQNNKYTNGLVGYWSFNGPDVTDTYIYDRSGQGNNGYLGGIATSTFKTIGKSGQGGFFNGSLAQVNIANSSSLDLSGAVTMSAWIKTSTTTDYAGIIQKSNSSNQGYQVGMSTAASKTTRCDLFNGVSYSVATNGTNVVDGAWHHVLCTYNGTTGYLYIDGVAGGAVNVSGLVVPSGQPVTIGFDRCCGAGRHFNGSIDEVRIYNRGFSASEVKQLYLMGR